MTVPNMALVRRMKFVNGDLSNFFKKQPSILYGLVAGIIFLVAFWLRMNDLTRYPFWFDEIWTERYVPCVLNHTAATLGTTPMALFFRILSEDYVSPLYPFLVWVYGHWGEGLSLRFLSVVMGMAALGVFYAIALHFLRRKEAIVAVMIMAVSPFHIWYAQEARAYTTSSFFSLVAIYCLLMAVKKGSGRWNFLFFCAGIVAVLASYYSIILLVLAGSVALRRNHWKVSCSGIIFLVFIGLACLLLVPTFLVQLGRLSQGVLWLPLPDWHTLLLSPLVFTAGYLSQPSLIVVGLVLCWALWVRGLFVSWSEDREKFMILFLCSGGALGLIFLVSWFWIPIYLDRQLIVFAPFFYICMVRAMVCFKQNILKFGSMALMAVFMVLALAGYDQSDIYCYADKRGDFYQGVHPRKEYRALMEYMLNDLQPGERIVTADVQSYSIVHRSLEKKFDTLESHIFMFNRHSMANWEKKVLSGISGSKTDNASCGERDVCGFFLSDNRVRKFETRDLDQARVWFVSSSWDHNMIFNENVGFAEKWIRTMFRERVSFDQDGFRVCLYEKKGYSTPLFEHKGAEAN